MEPSREALFWDLVLRRERKHLLGALAKHPAAWQVLLEGLVNATILDPDSELPLILHDRDLTTARDWVQGLGFSSSKEDEASNPMAQAVSKLKAKHRVSCLEDLVLEVRMHPHPPYRQMIGIKNNDLGQALKDLPWTVMKKDLPASACPARLLKLKMKPSRYIIHTEEDDDDENESGTACLDLTLQVTLTPVNPSATTCP